MLKSYAGQTSPNKHFMQQVREDKRGEKRKLGPPQAAQKHSPFTRQPGSLVSVLIIYKHLLTDKLKETLPNIAVLSKYDRNPIIIVLLK